MIPRMRLTMRALVAVLLCGLDVGIASEGAHKLDAFAAKVAAFRDVWAPISADDLPRTGLHRPDHWVAPIVNSTAALTAAAVEHEQLTRELAALRGSDTAFASWDRADQVDYWAVSARLARTFWELYILRPHVRDPGYYVLQSAGAVWDVVVRQPSAWPASRIETRLVDRVEAIPTVLRVGETLLETNLATVRSHAEVALETLGCPPVEPAPRQQRQAAGVDASCTLGAQLTASLAAVGAEAPPALQQRLASAAAAAAVAISRYATFLQANLGTFSGNASVGEGAYLWFLHHVSLVNMSVDEVATLGKAEVARATAQLLIERHRNDVAHEPTLGLYPTLAAQIAATQSAQAEVKRFLQDQQIVTVPDWLPEYTVRQIPAALGAFDYSQLGEEDDFTSANESAQGLNFVRYVPTPSTGLPFFLDAMARDPRPVIVHEGIPGHWFQFSLSWRNVREARRRWIDSVANEGLAFYMETVTFAAGLFDVTGSRRAREIMLRFRQLRGLRAVLDSGLASGSLSPGAAAALLVRTLAMSTAEASGEVAGALVDPVQMSSYVVGKSQILAFLALELAGGQGNVSVQEFNDRLETEGNLPVALQQHDRGVAVLPASFLNLHSAYPGVPADRIEILASSPDRVRHLPGVPPSSADQPTPQMFSGYVNVNADRGLYYFLVHSVHADAAGTSAPIDDPSTPVVIWLQGGNGCSSLVGAFSENGPFYSNDGVNLTPNPHGWHTIAHMLYLDRPAGAGYSFTRSKNYSSFANDRQTAEDSVALLRGVLQTHPWLCGRKVFVAGESYAGHFVAQLATLLTAATPALCVSLGGVLAGNAVVDINQTNFAWFENGATHSLVPTSTWADIKQSCDFEADLGIDGNGCPSPQTPTCHSAIELWLNQSGAASGALSLYDYYADACTPENADAIGSDAPCIDATTTAYLNQPSVRAALHVSPEAPPRWAGCSGVLNDAYNCTDTLQSVVPLYTALRNRGVAVLVYSGDVDGIVPTKASERWVGLTGKATPWRQWSAGSVLAGYTYDVVDPTNHTTTVATVRGAGHMVPRFRGLAALALVSRFLSGDPL